ncbi:hypothetical protein IWX46DRAFT_600178 [Phyllosticta citricarpa]|uniref:Secreted protein n=1 Tax=Phyllosticta citricarpa TaxID=55181 RepID=A0ABR1MDA7_9PEZI
MVLLFFWIVVPQSSHAWEYAVPRRRRRETRGRPLSTKPDHVGRHKCGGLVPDGWKSAGLVRIATCSMCLVLVVVGRRSR